MARRVELDGVSYVRGGGRVKRANFWIAEGYLDSVPEMRGDNDVVPYVAGQLWQPKIEHELSVGLEGWINGVGATIPDQQTDFWATVAILQPSWAAAQKAMTPLIVRVSGGVAYSTSIEVLTVQHGPLQAGVFRRYYIEARAITFPVWTAV